jgi:hypothetical protein
MVAQSSADDFDNLIELWTLLVTHHHEHCARFRHIAKRLTDAASQSRRRTSRHRHEYGAEAYAKSLSRYGAVQALIDPAVDTRQHAAEATAEQGRAEQAALVQRLHDLVGELIATLDQIAGVFPNA